MTDQHPTGNSPTATEQAPPAPSTPEPRSLRAGLRIALWTVSIVGSLMAATGQLGFADWADVDGPARYGVPVMLEAFAVVLLLLGYQQGRRRRSPWPLWTLAGLVGGFAVYTNVAHAGHRAGLVYGTASVVALLGWFIKLRLDLTDYWLRIGHIPPARPKLGRLFTVAPRLAIRAWIIAVRRRITTTEQAVSLAEVFLAIVDDAKRAKISTALAKRTAWRKVAEMSGGLLVELPQTAEVEQITVTVRQPEPVTRPSLPVASSTVDDEPVHAEPSTRPAAKRRTATRRPDADRADGPVRLVYADTVRANAAVLRERYGSDLPSGRTIRAEMQWSADRTRLAVDAHTAGVDLEERSA